VRSITIIAVLPFIILLAMHATRDGRIPAFGRFESITWYSLSLTLAYLHLSFKHKLQGISGILLPLVTVMLILAAPGVNLKYSTDTSWPAIWLSLHVVTAFIGYALFSLAGILAGCYLIQDNNLKQKRFGNVFERLPSLETLDSLMRRQIAFAFITFTASIVFGIVLIQYSGNANDWYTDPKIAATAATWFVYAILLHLRTGGDRHGKKIAIATILGILLVIFTFIGVHMIAESTHDFVTPSAGEQQR
ncbi:hypothetical protein BVX94_02520, partial [bacterium B17]